MKKKVVATNRIEKSVLEQLKEKVDVTYFDKQTTLENDEFVAHLKEAEGLIGTRVNVNSDLLDVAPKLKIVSTVSVGYNRLDIEKLTKRNIMATNTPDVLTETVADTMFGLLLATARRIPELDRYVKDGKWTGDLSEDFRGVDVHQRTIGIIGMGRIGEAIAKRAHDGFSMNILYHNRSRRIDVEKRLNAQYRTLEQLLQEADFIVLMTPLTNETKGLIGAREFALMKKSAVFINGSRGQTVVERDLILALERKEIRAAGLDVFEKEPVDKNNQLLKMANVVTLPHIGSSTYDTEVAMSKLACENLLAGLQGKRPPSLINKEVWEKMKHTL